MKTELKPIVCKLTSSELRLRKATVIAHLKTLVLEKKALADGYCFRFDNADNTLDHLIAFIKTERLCCDFFSFQLTVEENEAWLNLTGPDGVKEFIENEIGL